MRSPSAIASRSPGSRREPRPTAPQQARQLEPHLVAQLGIDVAQRDRRAGARRDRRPARAPARCAASGRSTARAARGRAHGSIFSSAAICLDPRARSRLAPAARPQRARDVLEGRHMRKEREVLERHADVALARAPQPSDRAAVDPDVALVRLERCRRSGAAARSCRRRTGRRRRRSRRARPSSDTPSSTARIVPNVLLTVLRSSRAMQSALHRAEGQALDQVALRIEREQQGRRDREHDRPRRSGRTGCRRR